MSVITFQLGFALAGSSADRRVVRLEERISTEIRAVSADVLTQFRDQLGAEKRVADATHETLRLQIVALQAEAARLRDRRERMR